MNLGKKYPLSSKSSSVESTLEQRRLVVLGAATSLLGTALPAPALCVICDARAPEVTSKNVACVADIPNSVSFVLCNHELEAVTATSINPTGQLFATHLSPPFPFTIQAGECVLCTAQGVSNTEFDCSGNFGFGYEFTSESGLLEGTAGAVNPGG